MSDRCPYFWPVSPDTYGPQKNALRVEIIAIEGSCGARHKRGTEHIDAIRWVGSGGSAMTVFVACPRKGRHDDHKNPCKVYADIICQLEAQAGVWP